MAPMGAHFATVPSYKFIWECYKFGRNRAKIGEIQFKLIKENFLTIVQYLT